MGGFRTVAMLATAASCLATAPRVAVAVVGAEFRVNASPGATDRTWPRVAFGSDGAFMMVWESDQFDPPPFPPDPVSVGDIFVRRYSAGTLGPEMQVNSLTTGRQSLPAIAARAGDYVVVFGNDPNPPDTAEVFLRRLDSQGVPLAAR